MDKKCIFLNDYGMCKALNIKKIQCATCNFYQTQEEYNCKEQKVKQWYKRRGLNYETVLENMREKGE